MWWTCPSHRTREDPAVARTQWMIPKATDAAAPKFLWLRGLLPSSLLTEDLPAPNSVRLFFVGRRVGRWRSGVYFTDGSGGKYGSVPTLRRCGCGIAPMDG